MNLDELIADALARKAKPKKRTSRPARGDDYARTKEELRKLQLDACVPKEVHLRVTHQYCECGAEYISVNNVPLLYCEGNNLKHHRPIDGVVLHHDEYVHLPKKVIVKKVDINYCEDCFVNARYEYV